MSTKNSGGVTLIESTTDMTTPMNRSVNELTDLIRGKSSVDVAGSGDYTLSVTDDNPEARRFVVKLTGLLTGARNVIVATNSAGRAFIIWNATTGAHALTVKTAAGTGVVVTQGRIAILFHDDTNILGISEVSGLAPRAHAFHNTTQSLANNTETVLDLNSELYDTDTIHDNAVNNSRLTCKTAGDYGIKGGVSFAANPTGLRYIVIKINGVAKQYIVVNAVNSVSLGSALTVTYTATLAANDIVQMWALQDSGGALNVTSCYLAMEKIG